MYGVEHSEDDKIIKIDIREITLISKTTSDGLLRISTRSASILYTSFKFLFTVNINCVWYNLVARARDPVWEESWGSGKEPKRMHGIHCIPLLSDPVH